MPHSSSMAHIAWLKPLYKAKVKSMTRGTSRICSPFFFSAFTNIQPGREQTLIIITFKWISSHKVTSESTFCLRCPCFSLRFSLFLTHSVVYIQNWVYSNTIWIRAEPDFAYSHWWLFYSCFNTRRVEFATVGERYMSNCNVFWNTGKNPPTWHEREVRHNTKN